MTKTNQKQNSGCIRVLVANDCPLILAGIHATVAAETDLVVVGEATDSAEVQRLSQELEPDVLLLDLEMLGLLPIETVTNLHQHCPAMQMVALTNGDNKAILRDLVAVGIAGYILKHETPGVIIQAIRSVTQGGTWFSQSIVEKLAQQPSQAETHNLTEDELALLLLVVAGQTDGQISRELNLSERTVRNHLQNVYDKLGVNTRIEAAVWAVRLGLA